MQATSHPKVFLPGFAPQGAGEMAFGGKTHWQHLRMKAAAAQSKA